MKYDTAFDMITDVTKGKKSAENALKQ